MGANTINAPSTCLGGAQMGPATVNQAITLPSFTPGVTTNRLYNVGGNLFFNGLALATGGSVGPGTATFIPVFTGAASIGNSVISQVGTAITIAGTVSATVFGTNSFASGGVGDHNFLIGNTTAGVANRAVFALGNNLATNRGLLTVQSSTYTTSGAFIADGVLLSAGGVGGLSLRASDAAGIIHFFTGTGTTERGQITAAGLWNWTTFGTHLFSAGGTGNNTLLVKNATAGAGNFAQIGAQSDTVTTVLDAFSSTYTTAGASVQSGAALYADGAGGLSLAASHASGAVRIYTGSATLRATYDSTGNYRFATTDITDSPAVPTISSGFGTSPSISGRNYAFKVIVGTGSPTTGTVDLGIAYATNPVCVASPGVTVMALLVSVNTAATTTVTISSSVGMTSGMDLNVLCRGK